ncbi:hypothetical protein ACFX10_029125 [Malus domestica]|uniref:beta-glucosidase 13-like isoform X1 n=1 Tax=Malus domestica TaxID=3750 RepID=UPI003975AF0A
MATRLQSLLLGVLLLTGFAAGDGKTTAVIPSRYSSASLNRSSFPSGFVFGSASASYQYEGAWDEGGKGPSIWDNFTHQYPEKIIDGSNGDVADDQYHRYKEDVKIMNDMGLDAYRFSISWSRLLPNGKLSGGVNKEGVQYYNNLINELLNKGVTPYATIFHWDLPQALEEEYGGFLNRQIVNHFRDYAELCFKLFGDRVKHWITLNEPYTFITFGYASGELAPGRCSAWQNLNCTGGDSATEPYIVAHHFLLAHAHAVKVYKTKYQASQEGVIGITLATNWFVPVSNATRHRNAANRSLDFMFGWFMEPLTSGQYPHSMQVLVKERLPKFTQEESKLIKGSFDFVGMNYYTTHYSSDQPHNNSANASFLTDARVFESTELNGVPIGPPAASSWLVIYPKGIREILLYAKHKYNNPLIYITENGLDEFDDPTLSLPQSLNDTHRIDYHYHHLDYLRKAINDGVNVKGYFAWSLLDNFEWASGYTLRFGFVYIDYNDGLKRHPKLSASWYKSFLG